MNPSYLRVRKYLVDELRKDLVGPGTPDEELTDRPTVHYLTGILYPLNSDVDPEQDDDASGTPEEDDEIDPGTLMAMATNPSSIGMTFLVENGKSLVIECRAAHYVEVPEVQVPATASEISVTQSAVIPSTDTEGAAAPANQNSAAGADATTGKEKARRPRSLWPRRQLDLPLITLEPDSLGTRQVNLSRGLELYMRVRARDDYRVVTVSLMNTNEIERESPQYDEYCFFQPEIVVSSTHSDQPIFIARAGHRLELKDEDRERNELLYRHAREFAVGHGCAASWEVEGEQNATVIRTAIVPEYEIRQLSPDLLPDLQAGEMKFLANAEPEILVAELTRLVDRYQAWIKLQEAQVPMLADAHQATARRHIESLKSTVARILRGIELIRSDTKVRRAFQLANKAMLIQRSRVEWIKMPASERPPIPEEAVSHRWRPFQLAFILLCLGSIADPDDPARNDVDLLWFPTGGGKTEAYLGLTAFTIFHRRLVADDKKPAAGVTVLMRYTLRLLTLQQYQRAALLIMACESIRRSAPLELGDDQLPISLGLWVGGGAPHPIPWQTLDVPYAN